MTSQNPVSVLSRIAAETGETAVHLVLDGDTVRRNAWARGSTPGSAMLDHILPMSDPISAYALLASLPKQRVEALFPKRDEERHAAMVSDLALCRARGYAIVRSQSSPGMVFISAAIPDKDRPAALVVAAREDRIASDRQHVIGRNLIVAARQIAGVVGEASLGIDPAPRPVAPIEPGLRCVLKSNALVGEGPVWNDRLGRLDWVDLLAPAVHSFDPATAKDYSREVATPVSAMLPSSDGKKVLVNQHGIERFDFDTGEITPLIDPEAHLPDNRFNDAKCDRRGRLWAGTMALDATAPAGSLYCIEGNRAAWLADTGFYVSNGLGWSPDDRTMYFADSGARTVYAYDFDLKSGSIANRRVFFRLSPERGRPDGLSVDAEGFVWIALWDGWQVLRYSPRGDLDRTVTMPVPRPSSCCFGGRNCKTLFITSARIRLSHRLLDEAPLSGGVFALDVDVPGQRTIEFAV